MNFKTLTGVLLAGLLSFGAYAQPSGKWNVPNSGLPYMECDAVPSTGEDGTIDDPCFILGNSRIKLATHVSGLFQIMSAERVPARFNADPERQDYARGTATLVFENDTTRLIGVNSIASDPERYDVVTGMGFTRYDYTLDCGLKCSRMISVMPSEEPGKAAPCFLLTFTVRNTDSQAKKISYDEVIMPHYVPVAAQSLPLSERTFRYPYSTAVSFRAVEARFSPIPQKFVHSYLPDVPFGHEVAPQTLFVYSPDAFLCVYEGEIHAMFSDEKVKPGREKTFSIVVGFADGDYKKMAEDVLDKNEKGINGAYPSLWKECLPDFSAEKNRNLKAELYRNAHTVEASAVYDSYFGETFISQGGDVTYKEGTAIGNARHLQAAYAASYTNPALARSAIRYVMMHSDFLGRISDGNIGYGFALPASGTDGDVQLEVFNAVSQYLRITGDYSFIDDRISLYPLESKMDMSVLQLLERYFIQVRDYSDCGGDKALLRRKAAKSAVVLPEFIAQLKASGKVASDFTDALELYRKTSEDHFMADPGDVASSSSIYLLQMPSVDASLKREVYNYIVENDMLEILGGFPFVLGVETFDTIEAMKLFRKLALEEVRDASESPWKSTLTAPDAWSVYLYMKLFE